MSTPVYTVQTDDTDAVMKAPPNTTVYLKSNKSAVVGTNCMIVVPPFSTAAIMGDRNKIITAPGVTLVVEGDENHIVSDEFVLIKLNGKMSVIVVNGPVAVTTTEESVSYVTIHSSRITNLQRMLSSENGTLSKRHKLEKNRINTHTTDPEHVGGEA